MFYAHLTRLRTPPPKKKKSNMANLLLSLPLAFYCVFFLYSLNYNIEHDGKSLMYSELQSIYYEQ